MNKSMWQINAYLNNGGKVELKFTASTEPGTEGLLPDDEVLRPKVNNLLQQHSVKQWGVMKI